MKTSDLIVMCMRNLVRRKFRTLLTMAGVVLGTCAVVMMIALGLGMKESLDQSLAQMGDLTVIQLYSYGGMSEDGEEIILDDEAMQMILALPNVRAATPIYYPRYLDAQIYGGRNNRYQMRWMNLVGVYPEAMPLLGFELLEGSWEDAFTEQYDILVGQYTSYEFQDTRKTRGNNRVNPYPDATGEIPDPYVDMLNDPIVLHIQQSSETARKIEYRPRVIGMLKEDYQRGYETSRGLYMSVEDVKELENAYIKANKIQVDKDDASQQGYNEARVKVTDIEHVGAVEEAIKAMGYETYSMETVRAPMLEQTQKQQRFLGAVAGVSLVVAALFIANTMLMSVYERTREIGVMKVVGCFVHDIRKVFLLEAGLIGLMGGIVGVGLSYLLAFLLNNLGIDLGLGGGMAMWGGMEGASNFVIPLWLVLAALCFSTMVGLLSGYYPASRAVRISALTAIKQE